MVGQLIKRKRGSRKLGAFGVSLSNLLAADLIEDKMGSVPRVVVECLNAIRKKGLDTPGIFRISGSSKRMKEIRDIYMTGQQSIDWEKYTVHDVAGTLKAYLRELPDELIPTDMVSTMVEHITTIHSVVQRRQDIERCILGLQCFILLLPPRNASLLYTLFQFFSELSDRSSHTRTSTNGNNVVLPLSSPAVDSLIPTDEGNGMTAKNISIIMTPNFFHHHLHAHSTIPVNQPSDTSPTMASLEWLPDTAPHYTQQMRLIEMCILYNEHLWTISQTIAERISSNFQRNFLENLIGTHSNNNNNPTIGKNKSNRATTGILNRKSRKKKSSSNDFRDKPSLQQNQSALWVPGKLIIAQISDKRYRSTPYESMISYVFFSLFLVDQNFNSPTTDNPIYKEPGKSWNRPPTPRPEDNSITFDFDMRTLEPAFKKVRIHELFVT